MTSSWRVRPERGSAQRLDAGAGILGRNGSPHPDADMISFFTSPHSGEEIVRREALAEAHVRAFDEIGPRERRDEGDAGKPRVRPPDREELARPRRDVPVDDEIGPALPGQLEGHSTVSRLGDGVAGVQQHVREPLASSPPLFDDEHVGHDNAFQ